MLTKSQEKLIRSLHTKKGRETEGLCLVEGKKVIDTAGKAVQFTFTSSDTKEFAKLVTTETPQDMAGVARIPEWSIRDIAASPTIVVLDGIQDPGNVGSILRLCLGFDAALILIESADITSPKVIRSSVGALFSVPWLTTSRIGADEMITSLSRPVYRLEARKGATILSKETVKNMEQKILLIAGSEGQGIKLSTAGTSLQIPHEQSLESLNVGQALAIVLGMRYIK